MAAGKYTITVEQGATWTRTIAVTDDGTPRNLTGYKIRMHVRAGYASAETLVELEDGSGITVTDAAGGVFVLQLTATQTAALPQVNGYRYDLELEDGSGVVTRLLEGSFSVVPEVTR